MLSMSDTKIENFLPLFAHAGVPVAFLVPTPTGFGKSIMDATAPVRDLLLDANIHDFQAQLQGEENKATVATYLVQENDITKTTASLYRPKTKKGDPRIWIYNLKKYCLPCNLLALIAIDKEIYVFNLSNAKIANSLLTRNYCYSVLQNATNQNNQIAKELLQKLQDIHNQGFLPSITRGDPGVGDTLEHV